MVGFGDIVGIIVIIALVVDTISVTKQNRLLRQQNSELAELLGLTKDAAMIIRNGKQNTKDKRSDTKDGDQARDYRTKQE